MTDSNLQLKDKIIPIQLPSQITFKEIIGDVLRDGHEGILVKFEDSKALAEAIICLLKDDKKRHLMGRNARLQFKSKLVFDNRQTERFVRLFSG